MNEKTVVAKQDFQIGGRRYVAGGSYVLSAEEALRVADKVAVKADRGPARATRALSAEGITRR